VISSEPSTGRVRIRRLTFTSHVRASGADARRLVTDVVPPSGRERDGGRTGEWIVFSSHIDRLADAAHAAGLEVDDRAVSW
jgi:hypothetical protein